MHIHVHDVIVTLISNLHDLTVGASYVSENSLKILSGERQKEIESKIDDHTTQEQQIIQDTAALKQKVDSHIIHVYM